MLIGGCKTCFFTIVDPPASMEAKNLSLYDVQIWIDPGPGISVWWRGFIETPEEVLGDTMNIRISASGYSRRLERISVLSLGFPVEDGGVRFTRTDATTIARSLISRANAIGMGLTVSDVTAPLSGFVIESIQFNGSVFDALTTLGQLAGESEWGIDANKTFWFLPTTTVIDRQFFRGKDVAGFERSYGSRSMINRIHLIGRDDYRVTLEDTDCLVIDISQNADDDTLDFGKATSNQRAVHTFTTTATTFSAVDLKIGKTGWGENLITDGDMELNDGTVPSNWPKYRTRTRRKKYRTNPHSGSQCLEIRHNRTGRGRYGVKPDIAVTANQEVQFAAWVKDPEKEQPVVFEMRDGASNNSEKLFDVQNKTNTQTWYRVNFSITPSGTTVRLLAYAKNQKPGTKADPWYLDDVSLQEASDLMVSVVERLSTSPDVFDEENPLAIGTINFEDIPVSPGVIRVSMIAFPLDPAKTYGIIVESQGILSDSQYFRLAYESTASGLSKDDGSGWTDVSAGAYMETLLPESQLERGVWSEVIRQPHLDNDVDAAIWGKAILDSRRGPVIRASVELKPNKNVRIEETRPVPLVRIRKSA